MVVRWAGPTAFVVWVGVVGADWFRIIMPCTRLVSALCRLCVALTATLSESVSDKAKLKEGEAGGSHGGPSAPG